MRFYLLLALTNIGCFVPLYALNARVAPNPFRILSVADRTAWTWPLKLLYLRYRSADPFKIHFDFTFFALLAVAADATGPAVRVVATLLLALGFVEILYTTIMHSVFVRPPALASDLSLLRAGLSLAQRQSYWMLPVAVGVFVLIWFAAAAATSAMLDVAPQNPWLALAVAVLLLPPCLYHWDMHYGEYLWRTVYSPSLHMLLNLRFGALLKRLYTRDAAYYQRHNDFQRVRFDAGPNIVIVCVESYGSIVYRDPRCGAGISALLRSHEPDLTRCGYRFASTFSDAPLFAGGSWLSYASFVYGAPIDNVQLYDGLFSRPSNFGAYESLFHVLARNGYDNVLLCPLGGVDSNAVDWGSVERCFQSHSRIGFDDLGYVGPKINYLGIVRRHSALDQFSLNFGYERARSRSDRFSLFFCTLNSHYPWPSAPAASDDWRALNMPGVARTLDPRRPAVDRYGAAIRYQLDYILRFAGDRAGDAPLIILFGDHQPPFITPEHMGKQTPVHVLSQDQTLIDIFLAHGFADTMDLTGTHPRTIRHEGFLSLLMKGLQATCGTESGLELPYRDRGARVFEEAQAQALLSR